MNIPKNDQGIIKWNGVDHVFNAKACYDGDGLIKLEDGTILRVEGWTKLIPLTPGKLTVVRPVSAISLG